MEDNSNTFCLSADGWKTREVKYQTYKHVWTINGFSQLECRYLETFCKINDIGGAVSPHQQQVSLTSGSSGVTDQRPITFRIVLHPRGNKESNKNHTFFHCFKNDQNSASTIAALKYKIGLKFTVYNSRNEEIPITVYHSKYKHLRGHIEYIKRDDLIPQLQPDDEITLSLAITFTIGA